MTQAGLAANLTAGESKVLLMWLMVDWLYAAFRLTPEEVLREPTAGELCSKVFRMVKAACVSGLADGAAKDAWLEYVHSLV